MDGKSRGRRKTNWRAVNLADYEPLSYDPEEFPPPRHRASTTNKAVSGCRLDEVTTRSEWKFMGKQVRKMLIPGSISAFSSCMWVSFEIVKNEPIAAFSKIVELALPYWDALPVEDQEAWAERALAEGRRAHWIYVRNGRSGGSGGPMGASSHAGSDPRRSRKKTEWDDEYDDEELSDTDELPSRPTRKLNVDGDDCEPVVTAPIPKEFSTEEEAVPVPARPGTKTVTFKMDPEVEPELPREPWRERDGMRTVPPPPLTYRPIIVSANPPVQYTPPPSSYYPMQSAMRGRGGGYRRSSRGGFDMYPVPHASHTGPIHRNGPPPAPMAFR